MVEAISGYGAGGRLSGGVIDAARVQANRVEASHERNRLLDVSVAHLPTADRVRSRAAAIHGRVITAGDLELAKHLREQLFHTAVLHTAMAYGTPSKPH